MGMKKVMNSMGSTPGSRITHVEYANGDCEELLVTPVGPNLYRLEESTLFGEPKYHDVIEAETLSEGRLRFIRIAATSGLRVATWILPEAQFQSARLPALLDRIVKIGGNWERTFGGVLTVHLPPAEEGLIMDELNSLFHPGHPDSLTR